MYIKGFDENLECRGFKFEIGKEYKIEKNGQLEICTDSVFHFCDSLKNVDNYYSVNNSNRFCEIEVLGEIIEDDDKLGSNHIRVVREIKDEELNNLLGLINGNTGYFNTGDSNTGNRNTGDSNTGNRNTGDSNTSNRNTGNRNTGARNTGDRNTGFSNTGDSNTGDRNTGDRNTGEFCSCNFSSGIFMSKRITYEAFNKTLSELEYKELIDSLGFRLCRSFSLRDTFSYKENWKLFFNELDKKDKNRIKKMPHIDFEVFKEITGIDLNKE